MMRMEDIPARPTDTYIDIGDKKAFMYSGYEWFPLKFRGHNYLFLERDAMRRFLQYGSWA